MRQLRDLIAALAAEAESGVFTSVVTAENLDIANKAEFPTSPKLRPADGKKPKAYWLNRPSLTR